MSTTALGLLPKSGFPTACADVFNSGDFTGEIVMAKRKGLSKRSRFEVFKRDQFTCQYCGRTPPSVILHVDHVIALANGGEDTPENMITSCADCNLGKSDRPLDQTAPPLQDAMARARELSEQTEAYSEFLIEQRAKQDAAIKRIGMFWFNQFESEQDKFVFAADRKNSIRIFLRQLPEAKVLDAIEIAHVRKPVTSGGYDKYTWQYFCGVCWKIIKEGE